MAKKKTEEYILDEDLLAQYHAFVMKQIYGDITLDELKENIRKHKIRTSVIESNGIRYFTIYKRNRVIDQNVLTMFFKLA